MSRCRRDTNVKCSGEMSEHTCTCSACIKDVVHVHTHVALMCFLAGLHVHVHVGAMFKHLGHGYTCICPYAFNTETAGENKCLPLQNQCPLLCTMSYSVHILAHTSWPQLSLVECDSVSSAVLLQDQHVCRQRVASSCRPAQMQAGPNVAQRDTHIRVH